MNETQTMTHTIHLAYWEKLEPGTKVSLSLRPDPDCPASSRAVEAWLTAPGNRAYLGFLPFDFTDEHPFLCPATLDGVAAESGIDLPIHLPTVDAKFQADLERAKALDGKLPEPAFGYAYQVPFTYSEEHDMPFEDIQDSYADLCDSMKTCIQDACRYRDAFVPFQYDGTDFSNNILSAELISYGTNCGCLEVCTAHRLSGAEQEACRRFAEGPEGPKLGGIQFLDTREVPIGQSYHQMERLILSDADLSFEARKDCMSL